MLYVLIIICAASAPSCDLDHASWAEQSPPLFDDEDECFDSARMHLEMNWNDIPALKSLGEYGGEHKTVLICTEVIPTDPA